MILYAFNKVKNKELLSENNLEKDLTISDVLLDIFLNEVKSIIKNGIFRDYNHHEEDSLFIKGKIDVKYSLNPKRVKKHIHHDLFNVNNQVNQIIKNTLLNIIFSNANKRFKKSAKNCLAYFNHVDSTNLNNSDYKNIVLNKSNQLYDFALKLSILINKRLIPNEHNGKSSFYHIERDNETMSMIYEEFLRNFYKLHTGYQVNKRKYHWYLKPLDCSDMSKLPEMETDIEICKDAYSKIIIDAKYYYSILSSRYDTEKFMSHNMYQINTYLQHNLDYTPLRGILLYPSVDIYLDYKYKKSDDYTIEFRTIDLNQDWLDIEKALLTIIE